MSDPVSSILSSPEQPDLPRPFFPPTHTQHNYIFSTLRFLLLAEKQTAAGCVDVRRELLTSPNDLILSLSYNLGSILCGFPSLLPL